ncbi:MAG: hypothetical protein ACREMB_22120 [Candidatus Rokuibacteriota bacterium]
MGILQRLGRLLRGGRPAHPPTHVEPGARVRLRQPLATPHKVWIPSGAAGIVVGWDTPGRRATVELDAPRTVVTVPWSWIEPEPDPPPADPPGDRPP